jgi:O-methyltransferase
MNFLYRNIHPEATLSPWLNDNAFLSIYNKIKSYTLVDVYRCYELWILAQQSLKVNGIILEVGVWRGGTGAILSEATKGSDKEIFLADTFTGVVKAGQNDTTYKGGEHSDTSVDVVKNLISSLSLNNTTILEGIFPEETQHLISTDKKVSMLHSDVDVYSSSKDIVDWCLPKMVTGSVLVFDDYGFKACDGVTKFCNELRLRDDLIFTYNLNGHAIFFKK